MMSSNSTVTYDIIVNHPRKGEHTILANAQNGIWMNLNKDKIRVFVGNYREGGDLFNGGTVEFLYKYKTLNGAYCDPGLWREMLEKAASIVRKSPAAGALSFSHLGQTMTVLDGEHTSIIINDDNHNSLSFVLSKQNRKILIEHLRALDKK